MDSAKPMRKPFIIIFCVLAASLLTPAIAGAESSNPCEPGEMLAESGETGELECFAEEPEEQETEEAEEQEAPEFEVIGPEFGAAAHGSSYASLPSSPPRAAAPRKAAPSRARKGPGGCRRASTAQIRSDRLRVHKLHGKRRRNAERRLSLARC
jgi:hypothetical protein